MKNSHCLPQFQNETVLKSLSSNKEPNSAGNVTNYIWKKFDQIIFWGSEKSEKYSKAVNLVGPILLSQAAACDGNAYAIHQGAVATNTTPANLSLL